MLGAVLLVAPVIYTQLPHIGTLSYDASKNEADVTAPAVEVIPDVVHFDTPNPLRAIYMSQCVVGTPSFRERLVQLIEDTELNAVIIDVKDYTGKIAFHTNHPALASSVSDACGALDLKEFIGTLHAKGIYAIARITVFQDPHYTKLHPELAVKKASDGSVWRDYKGLSFIDVGAKPFWDYIVTLSKETYALGFDELNYDYIRFPSDGPMQDISYPFSDIAIAANPRFGRAEQLERFFEYLHANLSDPADFPTAYPKGSTPVLSADVFGMTTTNTDDLYIGQVLERTLPYFDYVAPMVYPSHYPSGFNGWPNPNHYPYEVIHYSMSTAVERAIATTTYTPAFQHTPLSTTTPVLYAKESFDPLKLRPWIQDFDYGGNYGVEEVRAQIQATYDSGLTSWMIWDPSNSYTRGALEPFYSGFTSASSTESL
jgi:hypothetical protein